MCELMGEKGGKWQIATDFGLLIDNKPVNLTHFETVQIH